MLYSKQLIIPNIKQWINYNSKLSEGLDEILISIVSGKNINLKSPLLRNSVGRYDI